MTFVTTQQLEGLTPNTSYNDQASAAQYWIYALQEACGERAGGGARASDGEGGWLADGWSAYAYPGMRRLSRATMGSIAIQK